MIARASSFDYDRDNIRKRDEGIVSNEIVRMNVRSAVLIDLKRAPLVAPFFDAA